MLGRGTYRVSDNGQTLTVTTEGVGLKGPFKTVAVFERLAFGQTPGVETKLKTNPLLGKWKANLSKSQRDPNHQFQSLALRFEISDIERLTGWRGDYYFHSPCSMKPAQ